MHLGGFEGDAAELPEMLWQWRDPNTAYHLPHEEMGGGHHTCCHFQKLLYDKAGIALLFEPSSIGPQQIA